MAWTEGIDVHRYSGLMDYYKSYLASARFVLSRCGGAYQNTHQPFEDNQWQDNAVNAPIVFPCFGAWWYFVGDRLTATQQADFCAELVIPHKAKLTLGFWLDCEYWLAGKTSAYSCNAILQFIDRFEERAGIPVRGIYTRQSIWDPFVAAHARWATLDLWAARYNSTLYGPWADNRFCFRDWLEWRFWQFDADGNGQGQNYGAPPPPAADPDIDLDRWCGTLDGLYKYAGLQPPDLSLNEKVDQLWNYHPEIWNT